MWMVADQRQGSQSVWEARVYAYWETWPVLPEWWRRIQTSILRWRWCCYEGRSRGSRSRRKRARRSALDARRSLAFYSRFMLFFDHCLLAICNSYCILYVGELDTIVNACCSVTPCLLGYVSCFLFASVVRGSIRGDGGACHMPLGIGYRYIGTMWTK